MTIKNLVDSSRTHFTLLPLHSNPALSPQVLSSMPGRVEISLRPKNPETYNEGHERCLVRRGFLEAFPLIWGLKKAEVEHTRCMHDPSNPADECRYVIRYEERWVLGVLRSLLGLAVCCFVAIYCVPSMSPSVEALCLAIALVTFLAVEGHLKLLRLRGQYMQDLDHMRNIVDLYDNRYMDLWKDSEELRRLTLDNRNLSAYVPPPLLNRLRGQREQVPRLGGTKRDVTILFTDIRGYSTMSEVRTKCKCVSIFI